MFPVEIFQMSLAKLTSILQEHNIRNCTPEQRASVRQQAVAFQLLTLLEEVIEEPDEIQ